MSMPEEAMVGGALEAQASHQLEGQAGGMLRSSSGRKGHAVASWCWLNPNGLMSSRVPGVVER